MRVIRPAIATKKPICAASATRGVGVMIGSGDEVCEVAGDGVAIGVVEGKTTVGFGVGMVVG